MSKPLTIDDIDTMQRIGTPEDIAAGRKVLGVTEFNALCDMARQGVEADRIQAKFTAPVSSGSITLTYDGPSRSFKAWLQLIEDAARRAP